MAFLLCQTWISSQTSYEYTQKKINNAVLSEVINENTEWDHDDLIKVHSISIVPSHILAG